MCVAFVTNKEKRVPDEWVRAAYQHNNAGAGIAYRDGEEVVWKKGMNLEEVQELNETVPLPYALHFRIPTCGGPIKKLTHPFPIEENVSLALDGRIKGSVLFHNGHWGRWKDFMLEAAARGRLKIPGDKWSDSRAMAWMAAHFGDGVLDLIDEKICAFGANSIDIYGTGWTVRETIWCSNIHWEGAVKRYEAQTDWRNTHNPIKLADDKEEISPRSPYTTPPHSMSGNRPPYHRKDCMCTLCMAERRRNFEAERTQEALGGASSETPFVQARRVWEEADKKWKMRPAQITKKKWKKAFKKFEEAERKLKLDQIQSQLRDFNQKVAAGREMSH